MRGLIFVLALSAAAAQPAVAAPASSAPPRAATDPERLELGAKVAAVLWPDGSYARIMNEMLGGEDGLFEMAMNLRPTDFVDEAMLKKGAKDGKAPPGAKVTIRDALRAKDPHFDERMRLTMKAAGEEMSRAFAPLEPKMRSGLAQALARRFDRQQLEDISAFFATASGKAYAEQSLVLFTDKAIMTEMLSAVPEMIKELPQAMERVKKATSHLPPPPKARSDEERPQGEAEDAT